MKTKTSLFVWFGMALLLSPTSVSAQVSAQVMPENAAMPAHTPNTNHNSNPNYRQVKHPAKPHYISRRQSNSPSILNPSLSRRQSNSPSILNPSPSPQAISNKPESQTVKLIREATATTRAMLRSLGF